MQAVWDKTNENVGLVNLTITTALELIRYWFQKLFYICVQIWEKLLSYVKSGSQKQDALGVNAITEI